MREKRELAISYMLSHPARELHLSWLRFVAIWAGGALHPIDDFIGTPDPWFRYVLTFNIVVAFGTLAGAIFLFVQRSPYALPCAVFPAIFPWAYYLTLALPRYRLPIDPISMILTSVAIFAAIDRLRALRTVPAEQPGTSPPTHAQTETPPRSLPTKTLSKFSRNLQVHAVFNKKPARRIRKYNGNPLRALQGKPY